MQVAETMAFDEQKVRSIADRVAASSGLEIADIEFHGAGKHRMLRVFIDRPGAVPTREHPGRGDARRLREFQPRVRNHR